jgi:hypothetical protein
MYNSVSLLGVLDCPLKEVDFIVYELYLNKLINIFCYIRNIRKESNGQPRLVFLAKLSFLTEGEIKTFHNKDKLKEFTTTNQHYRRYLKDFYI